MSEATASTGQNRELRDETHVHLALRDVFNNLAYKFAEKSSSFNKSRLRVPNLVGSEPERHMYEPLEVSIGHGPSLRTVNATSLPRFESYFQSWPSDNSPIKGLDILVPVGEYGERWSMSLLQATRALYSLLTEQPETQMLSECSQANEKYGDLLTGHTFQKDSVRTFAEGFQTMAAITSVLMAQKVEGYEHDPVALFSKLVNKGRIEQAALRLPISVAFPMVDSGLHFDHPLQATTNGVAFTDDFLQLLADEKAASLTSDSKFPTTHMGCPVAMKSTPLQEDGVTVGKSSGITQGLQIIQPYVEHFYNHPKVVNKVVLKT